MKKIFVSIVTGTFNEEGNVRPLYERIKAVMATLPEYEYEHLYIDNASSDQTVREVKQLAAEDPRVKLIVNVRNFGHLRSPYYGILAARGEAVISMASDLQDPPELIPEFLAKWREGSYVVLGVKTESDEPGLIYWLRSCYYALVTSMADVDLVKQATGFGLYDRQVVEAFRETGEVYPYLRGLLAELGFPRATIPFHQPKRGWGATKSNLYTLYDMAMLGFTSHSKVPLRVAAMMGFLIAGCSFAIGSFYLYMKLFHWDTMQLSQAPTVIGMFFLGGVQLIFTGILGEYIGAIHTQVRKRPLVIERERVNFDVGPGAGERSQLVEAGRSRCET